MDLVHGPHRLHHDWAWELIYFPPDADTQRKAYTCIVRVAMEGRAANVSTSSSSTTSTTFRPSLHLIQERCGKPNNTFERILAVKYDFVGSITLIIISSSIFLWRPVGASLFLEPFSHLHGSPFCTSCYR